ncbi:MAG: nitrous oxide reductase family maturation protein NosD [Promethearchaeota archaeon]
MRYHLWKVERTQRVTIVLLMFLLVWRPGNETRAFISLNEPPNCLGQLTGAKRLNEFPLPSVTPYTLKWLADKEKGYPILEFDHHLNEQQLLFRPPKAPLHPFLQPFSSPYLAHAPITISGNSDFLAQAASENWTGTGTEADPLVIEGYYLTNSSTSLVHIRYTTLYFRIQYCSFNGVNITSWERSNLYLENVRHGNIFNNTFFGGSTGVHLKHSTDNRITHNTLTNNTKGIYVTATSTGNIIANNTLINHHGWGIYSYRSSYNSFLKNHISDSGEAGILLHNSGQNTLLANTFENTGLVFRIDSDAYSNYFQTKIADNWVNGRPLIFWQNSIRKSVPPGAGQIILINTSTIEVRDQNISNTSIGVFAWNCPDLFIHNNRVTRCSSGISLIGAPTSVVHNVCGISLGTSFNLVTNNTLSHNTRGIEARGMTNLVTNNTLSHNAEGVSVAGLAQVISNNLIKNNRWGIRMLGQANTLSTNVVVNNTHGIEIGKYGQLNRIFNNLIANNTGIGIEVSNIHPAWDNDIFSNTIVNNGGYGIYISGYIYNTQVNWNTFIGNNKAGGSQAYDDASQLSTFLYNYWADWTSPDEDNDGFVDMPYSIDGGNRKDSYPLVARHYLSWPEILYPYEDRTYNGTIVICWTTAIDSLGYSVSYNVAYTSNNGTTWTALATDIGTPNYTWNTATVADGSGYQIKIRATSSTGLSIEVTSTGTFTISNFAVVSETLEFIIKYLIIGSTGAFIGLSALYVLVYVLYPRVHHRRKPPSEKK